MIDDQYLNDSSTFSLFSKKEIEQQKYIDEINIIVEKYNILENENQLISSVEKTFLYLINYVITLNHQKQEIPKDIENLFLKNLFLKEQINTFLEKKLSNITRNDTSSFFKDISIVFHILTIGTSEKVLESYSNYNYDSISNLFRFYESLLQDLFINNEELFSLTFDSFLILLKTFTRLCIINSIDVIREKDINTLIELMTETINIVKYTILLDETNISKLNSIQGKYLYYFSHLENINIDFENFEKGFEKYYLLLEKQKDGYILSKDNNFEDERDILNSEEFLVFKNYVSTLILNLLNKIENIIPEEKYFHTEYFQKILRFYHKNFTIEFDNKKIAQNINVFKEDLLNSLIYGYHINLDFTKTINYHSIIEDFIFTEKKFDNKNLETIYNILRYSSDIEDFKYYYIAQLIVESTPAKNDYHEFFKLSIFDLVINKSIDKKYSSYVEETFKKIFDYINNNHIINHLLSIYSKIYLSLSLFYSQEKESLDKSKKLYAIFMQINADEVLKGDYYFINEKIIENITSFEPAFNQNKMLVEFLSEKKLQLKEKISLLNNTEATTDENTKNILSQIISKEIFHKLCEVNILETHIDSNKFINAELEEHLIYVNKDYKIQILFSLINEKKIKNILNTYLEFIKTDICNILNTFKPTKIKFYYSDDEEYEISY
jgi:hypothetical protein